VPAWFGSATDGHAGAVRGACPGAVPQANPAAARPPGQGWAGLCWTSAARPQPGRGRCAVPVQAASSAIAAPARARPPGYGSRSASGSAGRLASQSATAAALRAWSASDHGSRSWARAWVRAWRNRQASEQNRLGLPVLAGGGSGPWQAGHRRGRLTRPVFRGWGKIVYLAPIRRAVRTALQDHRPGGHYPPLEPVAALRAFLSAQGSPAPDDTLAMLGGSERAGDGRVRGGLALLPGLPWLLRNAATFRAWVTTLSV
jgi:hypothetical protein